ncbi:Complement component C7 [Liparis tanakae]|uniref:Complement component C7 n=1 Tax=Liparis tanakae TaxID=230148 RepID=A0A4Z2G748_9TELE|nr:Complement component C7 [Liparis tanakae]
MNRGSPDCGRLYRGESCTVGSGGSAPCWSYDPQSTGAEPELDFPLSALALLVLSLSPVRAQRPVNCRWGPYGEWSECDGCSSTKTQTRHAEAYAQFGGAPCSGEATQTHLFIILKNTVELAQFQNSAPEYLTLAEGFWRALSSLPDVYDYSAYRRLLDTYGTHYLSEGSLGGKYQALLELDRQDLESTGNNVNKMSVKVDVVGGDPSFTGALSLLDLENPETNGEIYDNWASSVKDFPEVIDQKLRPLHELLKEVQCAGLKKLHLKRATEEYLAREHPCRCRPCRSNGRPLLTAGSECSCVCRPGTSGPACEIGAATGEEPGEWTRDSESAVDSLDVETARREVPEQQGVNLCLLLSGLIHGSWSCWSSWGSCSGGQRSRIRSCNNPAPSRGGHQCSGLRLEGKPCEDADVHFLQVMEPQCFNVSATPPKTCGAPPDLLNGFIQNPRDVYQVGSTVAYSCLPGHHLGGDAVAQCTEDQEWRTGRLLCEESTCGIPPLHGRVVATPARAAYPVGGRVALSCPAGSELQAEASEAACSPSLQWPSLPACARLGSSRARLLSVCQLGALRCLGRSFQLASDCDWPEDTTTTCVNCRPGTICLESKCVCQDASACPRDSAPLCVNSGGGGGVATTMTECEAGARRCAGEAVDVLGLEACPP